MWSYLQTFIQSCFLNLFQMCPFRRFLERNRSSNRPTDLLARAHPPACRLPRFPRNRTRINASLPFRLAEACKLTLRLPPASILAHLPATSKSPPASAELGVVPSASISIPISSPVAQPFPAAALPTPDASKRTTKRDSALVDEIDEEARTDRNTGEEYASCMHSLYSMGPKHVKFDFRV